MRMKSKRFAGAALAAAVLAGSSAMAALFTPGNLAVYRVGSGVGALSSSAAPVFIDEFTPTGTLVQSINMTTAGGSDFTAQGTATLEGFLNTSWDGRYLIATGYNTAAGTATPAQTNAAVVNRVIARVDWNGNVDLSTRVTDLENTDTLPTNQSGSPRSAVSTNGTDMWIVGAEGGVRFTTLGSIGTSVMVSNTDGNAANNASNLRHVDIFNGQLFVTTGSSALAAVMRVGNGTPQTSGQTMFGLLPGPAGGATEPQQIFMADLDPTANYASGLDTLYVASDAANAITKYTWDQTLMQWLASGTVGLNADNHRGLTGRVVGTTVQLFATRDIAADTLVTITDASGYNGTLAGTFITLATAGSNTSFKGVDVVPVIPEPASLGLAVLGALALGRRRH